jgi:hypothetical protein
MSRYIDQEEIYRRTNDGKDVFAYYFPNIDFDSRKKFKIRDNDKTASAQVKWFKGKYYITDFGDPDVKGLNAVDWVKFQEGLEYFDALKFIESVIIRHEIGAGDYHKPVYQAKYRWREMKPEDKKGEYKFTFKEKPLKSDLEAIGRYVNETILDEFYCRVVEKYELCSYSKKQKKDVVHIFEATEDFPIFLFDYRSFKKLYKPHEVNKKFRFLYIGEKPQDFIYGLERIEDADNEFFDEEKGDNIPPQNKPEAVVKNIFRVSGESDALNLASLGYHVYWLNSETAGFEAETYQRIDRLCEKHFQIMDLDATGRKAAHESALKYMNLFTLELPGWLKLKRDWRGNPCKDAKDFINLAGKDEDDTRDKFTVLIRRAKPMKFWEKSVEEVKGKKKVNYNINLEYYYYFLQTHGFYTMDSKYHKKAGYCYCKMDGKRVRLINPDNLKKIAKRFTKEWIRSRNLLDEIPILNKINGSTQISENNLQELAEIEPGFKNYSSEYETLIFKNCAFRITRDEIKRIKHQDLENYILDELEVNERKISHLIPHTVTLQDSPVTVDPSPEYAALLEEQKNTKTPEERISINLKISQFPEWKRYQVTIRDKDFIFAQFLRDLSRIHWRKEDEKGEKLTEKERLEQDQLFANLLFVIGYMTAEYKDPSKPWMVIIQDMRMSDIGKSFGRSGKSLISKALSFVRPSFYIGGRDGDVTSDQFIYDGYTRYHRIIEVDDLAEFAGMDFFYTQITGKRRINPKNNTAEILDYEESGKMIVSTNFELRNTDPSTLARLLNSGVSDYYHEGKGTDYKETRSPNDKFGRRLYDDFTDEEWSKFYNLVAYCIQMTKRFPKIMPPMENLEKRQLRREMIKGVTKDEEFFRWANDYFVEKPKDSELINNISPEEQGYLNTYIIRENAFSQFRDTLADIHQKKYTPQQFKKAITAWCKYYGFTLNPEHLCTQGNNIKKSIDGKTKECLYISTLTEKESNELSPEEEAKLPF